MLRAIAALEGPWPRDTAPLTLAVKGPGKRSIIMGLHTILAEKAARCGGSICVSYDNDVRPNSGHRIVLTMISDETVPLPGDATIIQLPPFPHDIIIVSDYHEKVSAILRESLSP